MIYDVQSWQYARFVKSELVYQRANKVLKKVFPGYSVDIHPATKKDAKNYEDLQRCCNRVIQYIVVHLTGPDGPDESHFDIGECLFGMLFDLKRLPLCLPDENDFSKECPEKKAREEGLILVRRPSARYHVLMNYSSLLRDVHITKKMIVTKTMMAGSGFENWSLQKKKSALQVFKKMASKQSEKIRKMLRHEEA